MTLLVTITSERQVPALNTEIVKVKAGQNVLASGTTETPSLQVGGRTLTMGRLCTEPPECDSSNGAQQNTSSISWGELTQNTQMPPTLFPLPPITAPRHVPAHDPLWLLPVQGQKLMAGPCHCYSLPVSAFMFFSKLPFQSRIHQTNQVRTSYPSRPCCVPIGQMQAVRPAESRGRSRTIHTSTNEMQQSRGTGDRSHKPTHHRLSWLHTC